MFQFQQKQYSLLRLPHVLSYVLYIFLFLFSFGDIEPKSVEIV